MKKNDVRKLKPGAWVRLSDGRIGLLLTDPKDLPKSNRNDLQLNVLLCGDEDDSEFVGCVTHKMIVEFIGRVEWGRQADRYGSVESIHLGDPKTFKVPTLLWTVLGNPRSHEISQELFDALFGDDMPIEG